VNVEFSIEIKFHYNGHLSCFNVRNKQK